MGGAATIEGVHVVLAEVRHADRPLIAGGRVAANPARIQVGLFDVAGRPRAVRSAWISVDDWRQLREHPPEGVRVGSEDDGRLWWTDDGGPFVAWDRKGWAWRLRGRVTRRSPPGGWELRDVASVEAWISEDWVQQGVRMVLEDGAIVVVAMDANTSVRDAPFYDGIDLDWDTSWCRQLARSLAAAIGCPYVNRT